MSNGPNDARLPQRSGRAGPAAGVSISIESDVEDNDSTTAEHEQLLPSTSAASTSASASAALTQQQPPAAGSSEHNQSMRNNSNASAGTRSSLPAGNIISSFLARQRSYTPVGFTPLNRRLQQSRSVGGQPSTGSSVEEATAAAGGASGQSSQGVRQLGFWRVNLNEVLSLSTASSTDALRSLIQHSNFRYQPAATGVVPAQNGAGGAAGAGAGVTDNTHILLNRNDVEAGVSGVSTAAGMRMSGSGSGGMGRSISLREGEIQQPRHPLHPRRNASVLGLTSVANNGPGDGNPGVSTSPPPTNGNGGDGDDDTNNGQDDYQLMTDSVVEFIGHCVRYAPIVCILLIKFVHDHVWGIVDLLLLQCFVYAVHCSLRRQVSLLSNQNYAALIRDACMAMIVVTFCLFMSSTPPNPFGVLVPPPREYDEHEKVEDLKDILPKLNLSDMGTVKVSTLEPKPLALGSMLYYLAVSDLLLKLLTILVKIFITMLPMHVIRLKVRARLYVLVEYLSQFYRALTPISLWITYLNQGYSGLEVISGGIFSSLYVAVKVFELVAHGKSVKNAVSTFRRNIDSERSPTTEELDAAGSVCPICHDAYNSPVVLECGHIFCNECVQTWFKREQTCPMCRAKVSDDPTWQDGATSLFHQLY